MDHQRASAGRFVDRWMSGELSDAERAEFEEHFFDCPTCAEELRSEQEFAANLRAALRELAARATPRPI